MLWMRIWVSFFSYFLFKFFFLLLLSGCNVVFFCLWWFSWYLCADLRKGWKLDVLVNFYWYIYDFSFTHLFAHLHLQNCLSSLVYAIILKEFFGPCHKIFSLFLWLLNIQISNPLVLMNILWNGYVYRLCFYTFSICLQPRQMRDVVLNLVINLYD